MSPALPAGGPPWRRLDPRLIWADGLRAVLSMLPGVITLVFLDAGGTMTTAPLLALAGWGLWGALRDLVRWLTTRYRLTATHVECHTGLLVRSFRSVARERIRTVDLDARLIHRAARVCRVTIGAGQTNTAQEAALVLDALSRDAAERLRRELTGAPQQEAVAEVRDPALAEFDRRWVVYNLFGIWALLSGAGLLFGASFALGAFGLDLGGRLRAGADALGLGTVGTIGYCYALLVAAGAVGTGTQFFTGQAFFRLTRERGEHGGSVLRTRRGLFRTREAVRDEARTRGVTLSEPLLWRWLGTTDTSIITTGAFWWSESTTLLPRGPRRVARRVAAAVLGDDEPLTVPTVRHPAAALRRRLMWALCAAVALSLATAPLGWPVWGVTLAVVTPPALGLALAGYRSLGHAVTDGYLVLRAGAMTRNTSALRRTAVSGVCVRQSPLQRRLGLATVRVSTAAGEGSYAARDLAVTDAVPLAVSALPVVASFRTDDGGSRTA
jgi:putative membrane protein